MKFWVLSFALLFGGVWLTFPAAAQSNPPKIPAAKDSSNTAEQEIIAVARSRADALTNHACGQWALRRLDLQLNKRSQTLRSLQPN
jgi:hypothetical protein